MLVAVIRRGTAQDFDSEPVFQGPTRDGSRAGGCRRGPAAGGRDLDRTGWHVNTDDPGDEFSWPTDGRLRAAGRLALSGRQLSRRRSPRVRFLRYADHGVGRRRRSSSPISRSRNRRRATIRLRAPVTAQACNNTQCLPPGDRAHRASTSRLPRPGQLRRPVNAELFDRVVSDHVAGCDRGRIFRPRRQIPAAVADRCVLCGARPEPDALRLSADPDHGRVFHPTDQRTGRAALSRSPWPTSWESPLTYSVLGCARRSQRGHLRQRPAEPVGRGSDRRRPAVPGDLDVRSVGAEGAGVGAAGVRRQERRLRRTDHGPGHGFRGGAVHRPFVVGLLTYVGQKGDPFLGFMLFFTLALGPRCAVSDPRYLHRRGQPAAGLRNVDDRRAAGLRRHPDRHGGVLRGAVDAGRLGTVADGGGPGARGALSAGRRSNGPRTADHRSRHAGGVGGDAGGGCADGASVCGRTRWRRAAGGGHLEWQAYEAGSVAGGDRRRRCR